MTPAQIRRAARDRQRLRRRRVKEAQEQGLPAPQMKRGRPRKLRELTEEEARDANTAMVRRYRSRKAWAIKMWRKFEGSKLARKRKI